MVPKDGDWVMGIDWPVELDPATTLAEVRVFIEKNRKIPRHRIQLRIKEQVPPPARDQWTLRKMGIFDGARINIEPTLSGSWTWEPIEYYVEEGSMLFLWSFIF